jgi:2-keto-4-pentenoate hydratase/2-oxohepta-3-ene-1,7-dioic acid hydratase in catechol pathway
MKLVTFSADDTLGPRAGLLTDQAMLAQGIELAEIQWADLVSAPEKQPSVFPSALDAIAYGPIVTKDENEHRVFLTGEYKLHAPLLNPPRVFAIGLNYREHAIETKAAFPDFPVVFFKLQTAIIGTGDAIVLPKNSAEPDYEAELAFVIGKGGYRIKAEDWREHVFGYTIINDVSARDIQRSTSQWSMAKSFPTFCPMGPAITTADEIADPHTLGITLEIGGEKLQNSNTSELLFKIPQLIEYLSSIAPLLPGDVVSTGTPSGVGMGRTPKRWLKPGETATVKIAGLGELTNPIVAE